MWRIGEANDMQRAVPQDTLEQGTIASHVTPKKTAIRARGACNTIEPITDTTITTTDAINIKHTSQSDIAVLSDL